MIYHISPASGKENGTGTIKDPFKTLPPNFILKPGDVIIFD
jgi:hypothetical protein